MKLIDGHDVIEHAEVNCEDRAFIRKLMHYIGDADVVEPKGDLIGRVDAIQALAEYLMEDAQIEWGGTASEDIEDWKDLAEQILKDIPSAEKQGEWERIPYSMADYGKRCSLCHFKVGNPTNFCPNCGARMVK